MELLAELQALFDSAVCGLQEEEGGNPSGALSHYLLAQSRARYILGALLCPLYDEEPGSAELAIVVEACQQLEATYSWAVCQLTGGDSCSDGSQEQQQSCEELLAAQGPAGDGLPGCSQLESRDAGGGLREARRLGRGTELPPDVGEVAQRCLREASGSLDDVVGLGAIKQELREVVLLPMALPQLFTGIRRPQCNLLFYGVPGTGKTLLVEKVAAESSIPLLCISPSTILSKWSGESEKTLRAVFDAAAQLSPAIIFIDEIDSLAPTRSSGDDLAARRVLTELLLQMTAAASRPGCLVFVMACTNQLEDCDPALLRRFDRKIEVPVPDAPARRAFFLTTVQRPEIASSISEKELVALAGATEGCTGSDLAVICREAAMAPLRELMQAAMQAAQARGRAIDAAVLAGAAVRAVTFSDFATAVEKIRGAGDRA